MRTTRILATFAAVTALVVGVLLPSASASALTAGTGIVQSRDVKTTLVGFNPGNMISDAVFTAKDTMTEAQIQAFFNSKVSRCLGGSDQYGPIICLKDYSITSVNRPADRYCDGYTGAPNESAARIIYRVAQSCGINPQVLIVMLQKEQSLVTHTWPSGNRYSAALGQGCPDGGVACDPAYVGFFHQIYGAARQMQIYMEGRYFTYYAPGKTWNILWRDPVKVNGVYTNVCGSAPVYVANKATSALYYYTPYQPNAASLAAGYGLGDSCSSHGNRNFYNYFTDWFGSTQVPSVPTLSSVNSSAYVVGIDSAGTMWGYPFAKAGWGERKQLASGLGNSTASMLVEDLSGTGSRDLLVRQGSRVLALKGTGSAYSDARDLGIDWSGVVLSTSAGDIDGDGIPDVITTDAAGNLMLWRGDDRGGLRPAVRIGWGWSGFNVLIGNVDLNGDGRPDLLGRDGSGRLWAFYGNGASGWISQLQLGQGWGGMTSIFSPGDFDGDGVDDILARTAAGDLWLYRGNGAGALGASAMVGNGWYSLSALGGSSSAVVQSRSLPAGAGDVDKDGAPDVLALSAQGTLHAYRGNGSGGWKGVQQVGSGWVQGDRMINLGDFNGDGMMDIGRITADGAFLMYPGVASGGYGAGVTIGNGWHTIDLVVGGLDYDGDRLPDVLGRDSAGQLMLYRGDGKGGWIGTGTPIGYGWGSVGLAFNAGDFDGDGKGDLIVRGADSSLVLYPTNGNGGWGTPRAIGYGWGSFTSVVGVGDFDRNGAPDVVARTATGELYLYRGNGVGGWASSSIIGTGWNGLVAIG